MIKPKRINIPTLVVALIVFLSLAGFGLFLVIVAKSNDGPGLMTKQLADRGFTSIEVVNEQPAQGLYVYEVTVPGREGCRFKLNLVEGVWVAQATQIPHTLVSNATANTVSEAYSDCFPWGRS